MKALLKLALIQALILLASFTFAQESSRQAIIHGRVIVNKDSIHPLLPESVIMQKEWPLTFKEFELASIDSSDFSFKIRMDLDQLTYGNLIINFHPEIDTTTKDRTGYWRPSALPLDFIKRDGEFIREYASRIIFSGVKLVVEPGDSLFMVINYDQADQYSRPIVRFSGTGGANNNLLRSRNVLYRPSRNYKLPLDQALNNVDVEMNSQLGELRLAHDSISEGYYLLLKTDIEFDNLSSKHTLIRASLYDPDTKAEVKRAKARELYTFFDTVSLQSEDLASREFRQFLNFYLEYLNRIITGEDIAYRYDEKNYYLARAIYRKNMLKTFLYDRLSFQMEEINFYPSRTYQYQDFMDQFPGSPESHRLSQIHKKRFPVSRGQKAPDIELMDSKGKTKHLSNLKGKVVILSSFFSGFNLSEEQQKQIEELKSRMPDKEVVLVSLFQRRTEKLIDSSPTTDYVSKENNRDPNLNSYRFMSSHRYTFIINERGIIEDCVYNLNISNETIYALRLERFTLLTRLKSYVENHTKGILIALSIFISLSLVNVLISRLKRRRQALIRKQLHSELKAIRSQLNPHFLFNSLNSIQNFINKSDKETANIHLSKFSMLMRKVIEMSEKESTSLQEELDFNKTFIELEQLRYGFKCSFDIDEDVDLHNTEIPSMIIQPFIENAIVHCMSELGKKGEMEIKINEAGPKEVRVEIRDNGKGFELGAEKGFGLKSSRERIDLLNSQGKAKIKLQIESGRTGQAQRGSVVRLIIPKKY